MSQRECIPFRSIRVIGMAIAGLALAGCTETSRRSPLDDGAADPAASNQRARYQSVMAGFTPFRPVEPTDWRRSNERVTPGHGTGR
jgi:hypothetical protein